ncbi:MAG TPA: 1-acyl-sn-glycerol-3-phosphate acyltransferase [Candidatus Coproplasma avicola]|uniref:1-acyl-sn-glycerol-3-phosphate acyltransferase n=1 Tax=Candidatus Coproplasma avicola TaxID=2840744 RepID=A0A9D1J960_9FIRM|nr:1-acyl-sn-glycerol-3-phosphate acyltransferase [Candidatus Coproplasma avicola]
MNRQDEERAKKLRKTFDMLRRLEKIIYRPLFPYKKHGNLTRHNDGPLIIIGNHYSIWDVVPAAMATDRAIHFMAKDELGKVKIGNWNIGEAALNWLQCIPVKRDGSDVQAVKTCLRYLKNGEVVNIFPEGTRNHSYDEFLPFKGGAAALAIKTHAPIVPVIEVERIRLFHRVDVIYGDPIYLTKYYGKRLTADEIEKVDEWLRSVMMNMRQAFIDRHHPRLKPLKPKKHKD